MERNELLIGLGGIFLSGLTYFAGVWRTKRQQASEDSNTRITRVLDKYINASQAGKGKAFYGLIHAGVGTLNSDAEIRELFDRIVKHGQQWDPRSSLESVDTHRFFQIAIRQNTNFNISGSAEALIAEVRSGDMEHR